MPHAGSFVTLNGDRVASGSKETPLSDIDTPARGRTSRERPGGGRVRGEKKRARVAKGVEERRGRNKRTVVVFPFWFA